MPDLKERMLAAKENSSAVLKMRIVLLKSKTLKKIFVFEGVDDKSVYSRWLKSFNLFLEYESFVCGGKKKLISLKKSVAEDVNDLSSNIYFFMDKDFDENIFEEDESTYVTGAYSFENYLMSENILYEILRDDFHCHEEPDLINKIVSLYSSIKFDFFEIIKEVNFQIYFGVKNKLTRNEKLTDRIGSIAKINLDKIEKNYSNISDVISFSNNEKIIEDNLLIEDFEKLNPELDYRGKYNLLFFKKIVELLFTDIKSNNSIYFHKVLKDDWRPKLNIDLENLAAKSKPPKCFEDFVRRIVSSESEFIEFSKNKEAFEAA